MSRIRSIHPGIWTDEDFAGVSMAARILYLGILTEADDHGVFEWKPLGLKMRIFPADNIDADPLLTELVGVDKISMMPNTDAKLGLVRNFCKFQRPKKPSYKHILPDHCRNYVGLTDASSEPVPNQFPTSTENPPQMEEEGGRREKKEKKDLVYAFEAGVIRLNEKDFTSWKASFSYLDVPAELIGASKWAGEQGQNWFHAIKGLLAKRNREAKAAKERRPDGEFKYASGIPGVV